MKSIITCTVAILCLQVPEFHSPSLKVVPNASVQHLFIITIDGFRWQELFNGADSVLIDDDRYTNDNETVKSLYWAADPDERRKRLMPFFWNVLAIKGQVYGNRQFENKVNSSNLYSLSYPGYNEIFTGNADPGIASNNKVNNNHLNVLEFLNGRRSFKDSVVAFTSWDVFPYILNRARNGLMMNSGYEETENGEESPMLNRVQQEGVYEKTGTRYDELTFITAKEYIQRHHPKVVYLGFGETDELAHQSRYDLYLAKAFNIDRMIGELWHWVQSTPGYKDQTIFLITTDHGRGSKMRNWNKHGSFIKGSSETWLAIIGPAVMPRGEMKNEEQIYQKQIAQTIANLVGENFDPGVAVAPAISINRVAKDQRINDGTRP